MRIHRLLWTVAAAALTFWISAPPVAATGSSNPKVKPVTNVARAHGSAAHAPKTNAANAHGPKAKTHHKHTNANGKSHDGKSHGGTTNASGNGTTNASGNDTTNASGNGTTNASGNGATNASSATAHGPKAKTHRRTNANRKSRGGTTNASGNGATNATGNNDATPSNNAQRRLEQNEPLRARLESRLPPGTDVNAAASGFRNQGQFVAAVNVSQKLGIRFVDLKALMTGDHPMSLGQAIHQLKGMDTNASGNAANTALRQANGEIQATSNAASNTNNSTPTSTANGPRSNN